MVKAQAKVRVQARSLRRERCPLCQGEGFLPAFRPLGEPPRPPLLGCWDSAEVWEACPECEGAGRVPAEPEENPDPWGLLLRGRGEEEAAELADWVAAYRRLRQGAKLPPEEAARAASLEVFGPLPF